MQKGKEFLQTRYSAAGLGIISFIAAWFMFIRAVDTGSLQQYFILIVLLSFGVNRLFRAVVPKK